MIDRRTLLLASLASLLPVACCNGLGAAAVSADPRLSDRPSSTSMRREGASGLPVVFFVHGGTWEFGKRSQVGAKPAFLLANGFCFVSIDYRMLPEADVAAQAGDVEKAYAFVRPISPNMVATPITLSGWAIRPAAI